MRVLVITRAPWRNDNNTGNTLTNLFSNMKDVEFYNLYFRDQLPQNGIAVKSFAISEIQLVKNLLKRTPVGREINEQNITISTGENNIYIAAKKIGTNFLPLFRDFLWSVGRWKSDNLKRFLDETKPDVIFMPVFNCYYPHKVLQFIKVYTNAKIILFHADDNYTLKQFNLSPLYWLYRFNLRKWVKKSVKISNINYTISDIQKQDYEKAFNIPFKVLTKGVDFSVGPPKNSTFNKPVQLVYTGNIGVNRWKSLAAIASTLEKINADGEKAQLKIYTGTPLTDKIKKSLNREGSSQIMGYVTSNEIAEIQSSADLLVHVEAMDLKNRLLVRQSFSTKIVDYLAAAKPILAFGPKDVASIDHLVKNDCAIVADSEEELLEKLSSVIDDKNKLHKLALKAFECGKKFHNKKNIDIMLKNDMEQLL